MAQIHPAAFRLIQGKVISSLRKKSRLSQDEFAQRVGVSQPTISRIEKGKSPIDKLTYRQIADALGLTERQLDAYVDEAADRAERAAESATGKPLSDVWALLGGLAVTGLIVFAVAAIIEERERKRQPRD